MGLTPEQMREVLGEVANIEVFASKVKTIREVAQEGRPIGMTVVAGSIALNLPRPVVDAILNDVRDAVVAYIRQSEDELRQRGVTLKNSEV